LRRNFRFSLRRYDSDGLEGIFQSTNLVPIAFQNGTLSV
jgi:hypothetical protein